MQPLGCPPNLHRLFAAIGDYAYTHTDGGLQVNLFMNSTVEHAIGGQTMRLSQKSSYPHSGAIRLTVAGASDLGTTISLRIPAWADSAVVKVDGVIRPAPEPGQYLNLQRTWNTGDIIDVDLGLAPRIIRPNPKVEAQTGRLAMMVGPLVYCVEQADNPGIALRHIGVAEDVAPKMAFERSLLGGVNVLGFHALQWTDEESPRPVTVQAIPYYTWANRQPGYMNVWLATDRELAINPPQPGPPPKPVPPIRTTRPAKR